MKRFLKPVYAGISGKKNQEGKYEIKVDLENNSSTDIIQFLKPYQTMLGDHIYWFGYKYNEGIKDKDLYNAFIEFIKNVRKDEEVEYKANEEGLNIPYSPDRITESELDSMILRSLNRIGLSKYNIDAIVYPGSSNHNLVSMMINSFKKYLKNSDRITFTELKKLASNQVQLRRKDFIKDLQEGDESLDGMSIDTIYKLQQELEDKGDKPFSIRKDIHPQQLRKYVDKIFENEASEAIQNAHNVLVVDDFKTSGTTILDIISMIEQTNQNDDLNIYVFTLMGNFKK